MDEDRLVEARAAVAFAAGEALEALGGEALPDEVECRAEDVVAGVLAPAEGEVIVVVDQLVEDDGAARQSYDKVRQRERKHGGHAERCRSAKLRQSAAKGKKTVGMLSGAARQSQDPVRQRERKVNMLNGDF